MARIKFLDVLEETKTKPQYNHARTHSPISSPKQESTPESRPERMSPARDEATMRRTRTITPENSRFAHRESIIASDENLAYETGFSPRRKSMHSANHSDSESLFATNKNLIVIAVALLFAVLIFITGYSIGKYVTEQSKEQSLMMLQQVNNRVSTPMTNDPTPIQKPIATTVNDNLPPVTSTPKPIKKVEPAKAKVKAKPTAKVAQKEYVVQVSAHASMEAAREIENKVRAIGLPAYISESTIGDAMFYRVRVRGFNSKSDAETVLSKLKKNDLGTDAFVLTLD